MPHKDHICQIIWCNLCCGTKIKCACICKRKLPGAMYFTASWLPFLLFSIQITYRILYPQSCINAWFALLVSKQLTGGTTNDSAEKPNAWRNWSSCFLLCQSLPNPEHCSLWPFTVNLLSWCTVQRVAFSFPWKEIISKTKYFLFTRATQNCSVFFFLTQH